MGFAAFCQKGRFLLFSFLMPAAQLLADAPPEKITLSLSNVPMETAFREIQQQSDYKFVYTNEQLEGTKSVSLSVKNAGIEEVLKFIFEDQPVEYSIEEKFIIVHRKTVRIPSDKINVTGTVLNEDGDPIPGVTISVKEEERATSSGSDGRFEFKSLNANSIFLFTGVNVQPNEVKINGQQQMRVILKAKVSSLGNVSVVLNTGYEKVSKERATGSFVSVDEELFNREVSTDVLSRLEGITSGLVVDKHISNKPSILIRGKSSLLSNTDPLIVLDNFPYEGNISNINPNDVESITVLRDAAAASIWGARAGNGVIVITTKRGKTNQPFAISLTTNLTISEKPNLFYSPQMSSSDFIDVEEFLYNKGFYTSSLANKASRPVISPVVALLNQATLGLLSPTQAQEQINTFRNLDLRNDMEKYLYRNAVNQQYFVNVSCGSANLNYLLSVGFDKDLATQIGNQTNRISIRSVTEIRPAKNISITSRIQFTQSQGEANSPGSYPLYPGGGKSYLYPYAQLADASGNSRVVTRDYRGSYTDTAGNGLLQDWKYRPLDELHYADNSSIEQDLLLNLEARYSITKNIQSQVIYQFEKQENDGNDYYNPLTYYARNLINRYTQINGDQVTRIIPLGGILYRAEAALSSQNVRGQLNYNRTWSSSGSLNVIGGAEIRDIHSASNSSQIFGYNDNQTSLTPVDFANNYPIYDHLNSDLPIPNGYSLTDKTNRFVSIYANGAYTYHRRYTFSASFRKDASNIFGVSTNNKWKPLWSAGGSWKMSSEKIYRITAIPYLNLRLTYGYSGNVNTDYAAVPTIQYHQNPGFYTNLPLSYVINPSNPGLQWEEQKMLNIGIDFKMKADFLSGSIDYFIKRSQNLIASTPIDNTTGFSNVSRNVAALKAHGIDVQLNSLNINKAWKWETNLFLSYCRTIVHEYFNQDLRAHDYVGNSVFVNPVKGKDVFGLYSYRWAGLDPGNGDPMGYLNKAISKDWYSIENDSFQNLFYHGSAMPLLTGALRNTISYKSISVSFNISFRLKYFFRESAVRYSDLFNYWIFTGDYSDRWQKPGDEKKTTVPSLTFPANSSRDDFYSNSQARVARADNIRLQDIRVSYDLGTAIHKSPFKQVSVYAYANNLGILWKAAQTKLDPDFAGGYVLSGRSYSVGLSMHF